VFAEIEAEQIRRDSFDHKLGRSNHMKKLTILLGGLGVVLGTCGVATVAQQTQAPANTTNVQQPRRERLGRRVGMRRRERMRLFGALRQLNLTEAQKQRAQTIIRANFESTKAQRQDMAQLRRKFREGTLTDDEKAKAKELRRQLHASRQNTRTQLAALLTPEQKTKLDEMIKNRRERGGRFGRRGPMANKPL
jgi:Spy/CpxP family protein refolding chaperone